MRFVPFVVAAFGLVAFGGCAAPADDDVDESADAIREDVARAPIIVRVPVRFTRNDASDVGKLFSSSWIPFTDVAEEVADGSSWRSEASNMLGWYEPDQPGAGYATAWFEVQIPYDTDGKIAYPLARVKLERELLHTEIASSFARKYSPLRIRRGSAQPCISISMTGALEGKIRAVDVPFTDEGFTERDWKLGDVDANGVEIRRVAVGTLHFSATCWPENVEGKTHATGGVAAGAGPVSGFLMIDKSDGQPGGGSAVVHMNLVENAEGKVSLGELFSTNGGILGERDRQAFDRALSEHRARFANAAGVAR